MAPQDFIKGWPHPSLLEGEQLRADLLQSFKKSLDMSAESLNYGDEKGAYMLGHPLFLQTLADWLSKRYNAPVDPKTLMATGGASMGIDLACCKLCKPGDLAVVEEPTYYLSFTMIRDRGMDLLGVPIQEDGMDLDALEKLLKEKEGKIKLVYTVPIHHNPTGICMSDEKRKRLAALSQTYDFIIVADEAYQLLEWDPTGLKPMFYYDTPTNPKIVSVGTFSKIIGPGIKVGWVQAAESIVKQFPDVGFVDSGNNPVIWSSCNLIDFLQSGGMDRHLDAVRKELGEKCALLCKTLREHGLEPMQPKGGYFVWVKSNGKMTGRSGEAMAIKKDKFHEYMRLCFAWLSREKIVEGLEVIKP
mmetsp:Transcript_18587/g.39797  ORF Transcript_18587/g.39797 Transcript_18587/m.39797 type:complete len:359 (-) Transcript_18587:218-1294(-)